MIVSVLLAASLATAPPTRTHVLRAAPRACPSEGSIMVRSIDPVLLLRPQDRRGDRGAQALESMPPADMHLTVMRSVGGCAIPTKIRENIQGDGRFAPPR